MTGPRTNRGQAWPCQSIQEARHLSSVARSGCAASPPASRKCTESFPEEEHRGRVVEQMAITGAGRRADGDSSIPTGGRIQAPSEARGCCFELPFWRRNDSSPSWKAPRVLDLCNWRGKHIED